MIRAGSTPWTGVDRSTIVAQRPAGEHPERAAVRRPEPAAAEGVGDLGGREAHQQRALQAGGHPAGQQPGAGLERARVAEQRERVVDGPVEAAVRAAGGADLGDPRLQHLRLAAEGAQHVEGVDVARALPDRVERRLAEHQRQAGLLDVAVAAEALERLGHHRGRALADPELRQRERDPAQRDLVGVARAGRPPRPAASRARWRPPTRPRGRRRRSASAACRRAARRRPSGARRATTPRPARAASAPPSRARSRAGSRRPSR